MEQIWIVNGIRHFDERNETKTGYNTSDIYYYYLVKNIFPLILYILTLRPSPDVPEHA